MHDLAPETQGLACRDRSGNRETMKAVFKSGPLSGLIGCLVKSPVGWLQVDKCGAVLEGCPIEPDPGRAARQSTREPRSSKPSAMRVSKRSTVAPKPARSCAMCWTEHHRMVIAAHVAVPSCALWLTPPRTGRRRPVRLSDARRHVSPLRADRTAPRGQRN